MVIENILHLQDGNKVSHRKMFERLASNSNIEVSINVLAETFSKTNKTYLPPCLGVREGKKLS